VAGSYFKRCAAAIWGIFSPESWHDSCYSGLYPSVAIITAKCGKSKVAAAVTIPKITIAITYGKKSVCFFKVKSVVTAAN